MNKWKDHKWLIIVLLTITLLLVLTSMAMAQVWLDQPDDAHSDPVTIWGGNDAALYHAMGIVIVAIVGLHDPALVEDGCQGIIVR